MWIKVSWKLPILSKWESRMYNLFRRIHFIRKQYLLKNWMLESNLNYYYDYDYYFYLINLICRGSILIRCKENVYLVARIVWNVRIRGIIVRSVRKIISLKTIIVWLKIVIKLLLLLIVNILIKIKHVWYVKTVTNCFMIPSISQNV